MKCGDGTRTRRRRCAIGLHERRQLSTSTPSAGRHLQRTDRDDALHADHVYELGADHLHRTVTVEEWREVLAAARTVVAVTARENYILQKLETSGVHGPAKYIEAGVTWAGEPPNFEAMTHGS